MDLEVRGAQGRRAPVAAGEGEARKGAGGVGGEQVDERLRPAQGDIHPYLRGALEVVEQGVIVGADPHVLEQHPLPRLTQHRDPGASRLGRKIDADVAPVHRIRLASTAAA